MATETLVYASLALALVTRLYVAYNPPTFLQQHINLRASFSSSSSSFPYRKYLLRRQTIDATTYNKHIACWPTHPLTLEVDHDSHNNHTSPSVPPSRLTCILDISEIHYHGSLAEFDHDKELNTAIRQIQALASCSCRNNNKLSTTITTIATTTATGLCCVDCTRQAYALCSLLAQHKLLKLTLTVIWEDGRWCCLEGRVLYALMQLRWGLVQVQVLLDQI